MSDATAPSVVSARADSAGGVTDSPERSGIGSQQLLGIGRLRRDPTPPRGCSPVAPEPRRPCRVRTHQPAAACSRPPLRSPRCRRSALIGGVQDLGQRARQTRESSRVVSDVIVLDPRRLLVGLAPPAHERLRESRIGRGQQTPGLERGRVRDVLGAGLRRRRGGPGRRCGRGRASRASGCRGRADLGTRPARWRRGDPAAASCRCPVSVSARVADVGDRADHRHVEVLHQLPEGAGPLAGELPAGERHQSRAQPSDDHDRRSDDRTRIREPAAARARRSDSAAGRRPPRSDVRCSGTAPLGGAFGESASLRSPPPGSAAAGWLAAAGGALAGTRSATLLERDQDRAALGVRGRKPVGDHDGEEAVAAGRVQLTVVDVDPADVGQQLTAPRQTA